MEGGWIDDTTYEVDGIQFVSAVGARFKSSSDRFCLVKPRPLIERYLALLAEHRPRTIVELGVLQGGSTAFLALVSQPECLVAFERSADRIDALDDLIADRRLSDVVNVNFGVDQQDAATVRTTTTDALAGRLLDLVVDDASHLVEPTRASFNALFPLLRPGGVFVIEDWSWAHVGFGSHLPEQVPLSVLIFELILALPSLPGLISEIQIDRGWAAVVRGPLSVEPDGFDLSTCYGPRGRVLVPELGREDNG